MVHLVIVDVRGQLVRDLIGTIKNRIKHPLLPEVAVTRIVFDNNPCPAPRVYVHSDGYDGDEIERLAMLCNSLDLPVANNGQIYYPPLALDPMVVFYGGAADGVEEAVKEGHAIDELAKTHNVRVNLCRPPAGTQTMNGPVQIAEYRPPLCRADPHQASALDVEIISLLRAQGYNVEAYKIEGGEPGMTFLDKFEH